MSEFLDYRLVKIPDPTEPERPISVDEPALRQARLADEQRRIQTSQRGRSEGLQSKLSGDAGKYGGGNDLDAILGTEYENIQEFAR